MRILNYKFLEGGQGWDYSEIHFKKINLLVGESGSGKTRLLNTIFNIGRMVSQSETSRGSWEIDFQIKNKIYHWTYTNFTGLYIDKEILEERSKDKIVLKKIVERNSQEFLFNGVLLPKLRKQISAISQLQEEDDIKEIFEHFGKIARRNFFSDELDRASDLAAIPVEIYDEIKQKKDIKLLNAEMPLSLRLQLLHDVFKDEFKIVTDYYKSIFKNIENIELVKVVNSQRFQRNSPNEEITHVFSIKEKNVKRFVPYSELSSGMQKVLLLIVDIVTLPGDWVYLIDEYENSLGVNAINFLPELLIEHGKENQFIITTHHPYLINNMPIQNWFLFSRRGSSVDVIQGEKLQERLGKSSQQAFIKLINDPLYAGG